MSRAARVTDSAELRHTQEGVRDVRTGSNKKGSYSAAFLKQKVFSQALAQGSPRPDPPRRPPNSCSTTASKLTPVKPAASEKSTTQCKSLELTQLTPANNVPTTPIRAVNKQVDQAPVFRAESPARKEMEYPLSTSSLGTGGNSAIRGRDAKLEMSNPDFAAYLTMVHDTYEPQSQLTDEGRDNEETLRRQRQLYSLIAEGLACLNDPDPELIDSDSDSASFHKSHLSSPSPSQEADSEITLQVIECADTSDYSLDEVDMTGKASSSNGPSSHHRPHVPGYGSVDMDMYRTAVQDISSIIVDQECDSGSAMGDSFSLPWADDIPNKEVSASSPGNTKRDSPRLSDQTTQSSIRPPVDGAPIDVQDITTWTKPLPTHVQMPDCLMSPGRGGKSPHGGKSSSPSSALSEDESMDLMGYGTTTEPSTPSPHIAEPWRYPTPPESIAGHNASGSDDRQNQADTWMTDYENVRRRLSHMQRLLGLTAADSPNSAGLDAIPSTPSSAKHQSRGSTSISIPTTSPSVYSPPAHSPEQRTKDELCRHYKATPVQGDTRCRHGLWDCVYCSPELVINPAGYDNPKPISSDNPVGNGKRMSPNHSMGYANIMGHANPMGHDNLTSPELTIKAVIEDTEQARSGLMDNNREHEPGHKRMSFDGLYVASDPASVARQLYDTCSPPHQPSRDIWQSLNQSSTPAQQSLRNHVNPSQPDQPHSDTQLYTAQNPQGMGSSHGVVHGAGRIHVDGDGWMCGGSNVGENGWIRGGVGIQGKELWNSDIDYKEEKIADRRNPKPELRDPKSEKRGLSSEYRNSDLQYRNPNREHRTSDPDASSRDAKQINGLHPRDSGIEDDVVLTVRTPNASMAPTPNRLQGTSNGSPPTTTTATSASSYPSLAEGLHSLQMSRPFSSTTKPSTSTYAAAQASKGQWGDMYGTPIHTDTPRPTKRSSQTSATPRDGPQHAAPQHGTPRHNPFISASLARAMKSGPGSPGRQRQGLTPREEASRPDSSINKPWNATGNLSKSKTRPSMASANPAGSPKMAAFKASPRCGLTSQVSPPKSSPLPNTTTPTRPKSSTHPTNSLTTNPLQELEEVHATPTYPLYSPHRVSPPGPTHGPTRTSGPTPEVPHEASGAPPQGQHRSQRSPGTSPETPHRLPKSGRLSPTNWDDPRTLALDTSSVLAFSPATKASPGQHQTSRGASPPGLEKAVATKGSSSMARTPRSPLFGSPVANLFVTPNPKRTNSCTSTTRGKGGYAEANKRRMSAAKEAKERGLGYVSKGARPMGRTLAGS